MIDRIMVRIFSGILFLCILLTAEAQNRVLNQADSLFLNQQYTQALEKYMDIYVNGEASSSMYLKMAFIQDGLGNYAEALYFLDKYYTASADRTVVGKIEELSEENDLSGYHYDDAQYFVVLLSKYRFYIMLFLVMITLLLIIYIVKKRKEDEKPIGASIIQLIVILMILFVNNFYGSEKGIVISNHSLLRSGPSAGAEPIEVISKGHKVKVLTQDDVWTKIIWEGEEVYIRNGRLLII